MEQRVWLVEKPRGDFQQVEMPRPALAKDQVLVRISAS
jgi:NADPH:quinone reductase-like Zn-dependent oxidoreductase